MEYFWQTDSSIWFAFTAFITTFNFPEDLKPLHFIFNIVQLDPLHSYIFFRHSLILVIFSERLITCFSFLTPPQNEQYCSLPLSYLCFFFFPLGSMPGILGYSSLKSMQDCWAAIHLLLQEDLWLLLFIPLNHLQSVYKGQMLNMWSIFT